MAEIRVERRERSVWPWIVGILALLLLAWFLWAQRDGRVGTTDRADTGPTTANGAVVGGTPAFAAYDRFMTERAGTNAQETGAYASDGLRHLADAIEETGRHGTADAQVDVQQIRSHADAIARDAQGTESSRHMREGAHLSADALANLHMGRATTGGQLNDVRQAAGEIRTDLPLNQQSSEVQRFFQSARDALRDVSHGGTTQGGTAPR